MTRTGKIARLPKDIRDIVNRRLDNGHEAGEITEWLNEQPAVKAVLEKKFEGEPIQPSSIHTWKTGGYLDWKSASESQPVGGRGFAALLNKINELKRMPMLNLEADIALLLGVTLAMESGRLDALAEGEERMNALRAVLDAFVQLRGAELDGGKLNLARQKLEDLKFAAEKCRKENEPKPKRTPEEQQARIRQILGTE